MSAKFRRFRITRKVPESAIITSIYFSPCDDESAWQAKPGQYLTLRIPTVNGAVLKTYSISNYVNTANELRITVKRESAPMSAPDAPLGLGSTWLHDIAAVGTEIEIAAPRGHFVLDERSQRPVVLLSGGVGQTPLLSMLHTLAHSQRSVCYIHACENAEVHAMHSEVKSLVTNADGRIDYRVCYRSAPIASDNDNDKYILDNQLIDKSLLQSLLPIDDYECYLCGPTPFMVAMYTLLTNLGIQKDRISHESFGKSQSLPSLTAGSREATTAPRNTELATQSAALSNAPTALSGLTHLTNPDAWAIVENDALSLNDQRVLHLEQESKKRLNKAKAAQQATEVVFAVSGVTALWSETDTSILDAAEQAGLSPEFSCRAGICNTCVCHLLEGEVEYFEEPLVQPEAGTVLICCSRPRGRVVLDL